MSKTVYQKATKKSGYKKTLGKAKLDSNRICKAYEFRIYPTAEQLIYFEKLSGLKRLYQNLNIACKKLDDTYKPRTYANTFRQEKPEAMIWLKEVDVVPLNQAFLDLGQSWTTIASNNKKGKYRYEKQLEEFLAGKRKKAPKEFVEQEVRFHSKKESVVSFHYNSCSFRNGKLFVTRKLGPLSGVYNRFVEGKLKSCTISRTPTGKWFVKIVVEKLPEEKCKNGKTIGIDWNCRDEAFLAKSDGTIIKCPRFLSKKAKKLQKLQKEQSRRYIKGAEEQSKNYYKTKYKVAKLHEKVALQRKDWLHKLSRELANNYQYIAFEDINLQVMAKKTKNSGLGHGKVLADQGFGMFRSFCQYKSTVLWVSPKNTSKTCHCCGHIEPTVVLGVEKWKCPSCGANHDRDINAALNIRAESIVGRERAEITNACGGPSDGPAKQEVAGSILQNVDNSANFSHL